MLSALAARGHVPATKNLDVWGRPSRENAAKVIRGLIVFGAPLHDLTGNDLTRPGTIFQIGVAPLRIDVISTIDGVRSSEAWAERLQIPFGGTPTAVR